MTHTIDFADYILTSVGIAFGLCFFLFPSLLGIIIAQSTENGEFILLGFLTQLIWFIIIDKLNWRKW